MNWRCSWMLNADTLLFGAWRHPGKYFPSFLLVNLYCSSGLKTKGTLTLGPAVLYHVQAWLSPFCTPLLANGLDQDYYFTVIHLEKRTATLLTLWLICTLFAPVWPAQVYNSLIMPCGDWFLQSAGRQVRHSVLFSGLCYVCVSVLAHEKMYSVKVHILPLFQSTGSALF